MSAIKIMYATTKVHESVKLLSAITGTSMIKLLRQAIIEYSNNLVNQGTLSEAEVRLVDIKITEMKRENGEA